MPVFISHAFENRPEFENVTDALAQRDVTFWNPNEIRPGASLREQLRAAIEECSSCIFIATRKSVESSWCGAELGAFWGTGKPIIVYLAEASLTDDELPQIVQGDVWERRIAKIADRAKEIASQPNDSDSTQRQRSSIAQLSVEQLEKIIVGAVSLAAASRKDESTPSNLEEVGSAVRHAAGKVLAGFQASETASGDSRAKWRNQILWVDDKPGNNVYERRAMEAMGLEFTLAESTVQALKILSSRKFAAIISDMGRREGSREGFKLLETLRMKDNTTPFFIYAGSNAVQHKREALSRGAQGSTNRADELVDMITQSLPSETDIRSALNYRPE